MNPIIEKTAKLCKLDFDANEKELFEKQFDNIVEYVSVIENLPIDDLEPLAQLEVSDNTVRKDVVEDVLSLEQALKNAPKKNENFIKVPKQLRTEGNQA
jgi:aspartyl-tRNA(Asn)/glutamyl-tRNA(Gln) amidotransferase subunit C